MAFFALLNWLDGSPLVIEPYRARCFRDVFLTEDEAGRLFYTLALFLRGKKNDKSLDLVLASLHALLNWTVPGGVTALLVATDESQAGQDLDLAKKLIRANEMLSDLLEVQDKRVLRRDRDGILEIRPGKDFSGQHGGKFDFHGHDEIHTLKDYRILEALAPDPTRESLTWICSYNTLYWRPGTPLYDMIQRGWKGDDPLMYFSAYTSTKTTDSDFADVEPERRANPSMDSWRDGGKYLKQQKQRLPSHMFRRLHLCEGGLPEGAAYSIEMIESAIDRGVKIRPPRPDVDYAGFVDMSGGSSDDATLGIAHLEGDKETGRAVLDCVGNQGPKPPFDPRRAVAKFAKVLKEYRCFSVVGDRYAGETFRAAFENEGIAYRVSELTKSQIYEALEPRLNAGRVVLLDSEKMESELLGLIWRGGKIDHGSGSGDHDDWANATAGAIRAAFEGGAASISEMIENNKGIDDHSMSDWNFFSEGVFSTSRGDRGPWG
jgi:hypothetical protein